MVDKKIIKKTDWTAYYEKKKSWFSTHSQKYTLRILLDVIDSYFNKNDIIRIVELGGGNSCFAKDICRMKKINTYDIIDNNKFAVKLFNHMSLDTKHHLGLLHDLLNVKDTGESKIYDFVYSVGLIEHFRGKEIEKIVGQHFKHCKKGGIVLITFPTPTLIYRFIRKCMELIKVWQFYDEEPIRYREIEKIFEKYGTVRKHFLNKKLPLTQMVVIIEK